jgi:hypothetical protein
MRTRVEVALLQAVLRGLAVAMTLASRRVTRFRRQVSRDLVVEIRTADGARQQFWFDSATRRMRAPRRAAAEPEVVLRFGSAREGLLTLLSPRAVGRIVEGMNTGDTRIDGNPVLILWFYGMTRIVVPLGSTRRPRKPVPVPARMPETHAPYSRRILTEPQVPDLSRVWPPAWSARAKLLQLRGAAGDRLPPG